MDPSHDINWFAIHAKRSRENFAALNVSALGLEVFFPRALVERPQRRPPKPGPEPLFPGYFFARFSLPISLGAVTSCPGVLQVVGSGRCPIPVEELVIREIQERIEPDGLVRLSQPSWKPGDRISIGAGPFEGIIGRVERELAERVAVVLDVLWNARVLVEKQWVQAEAA